MKMPKLIPENHVEIYEHFRNLEPSERVRKVGFAIMRLLEKPQVYYEGNANTIITKHIDDGGSVLVALNHQSNADMLMVGALGFEPCFKTLPGNTTAPGKVTLFKPGIRSALASLGVHPIFRSKDYPKDNAEKQVLRTEASGSVIGFIADYIDAGGHAFFFPEATRNKANPREILDLRPGIARTIAELEDPSRVLVVSGGVAYHHAWRFLKLDPHVVINQPFNPLHMSQDEIMGRLHADIQAATNSAFNLADAAR